MKQKIASHIPVYRVQLVRERAHIAPQSVSAPVDVVRLLRDYMDGADREMFVVLLLDSRHQVRGIHTAAIGTIDTCCISAREIFKAAILANSAAIIIAHNHPSGDCTPSPEDREMTRRMKSAGELMGVALLDSIIIGDRYHSMAECGLM